MPSVLRGLPKHLLDDNEEDPVIEYLALGVTWLVVATAFSVLVGKCIAAGQAGEAARHARAVAAPDPVVPPRGVCAPGEDDAPPVLGQAPVVPPQRQPSVPADQVG